MYDFTSFAMVIVRNKLNNIIKYAHGWNDWTDSVNMYKERIFLPVCKKNVKNKYLTCEMTHLFWVNEIIDDATNIFGVISSKFSKKKTTIYHIDRHSW